MAKAMRYTTREFEHPFTEDDHVGENRFLDISGFYGYAIDVTDLKVGDDLMDGVLVFLPYVDKTDLVKGDSN